MSYIVTSSNEAYGLTPLNNKICWYKDDDVYTLFFNSNRDQ